MATGYVSLPPDSNGQKAIVFNNVISGNALVASGVSIVTSAGVSCDPPSGTGTAVCGNINSNAADSGSPVKTGGVYNSSLPVAASGNRLDTQCDVNGRTLMNAVGSVASNAADSGNPIKVGAVFTAWGSLPVAVSGSRVDAQCDPSGTRKVGIVPPGTPVYGSNNTVAANSVVTLTIPSAKMGYLDGFDVDGTGASSAGSVTVVVSGILGGSLSYIMPIVAGNTNACNPLVRRFNPPLQASAVNTNIVISVPSFGSGGLAQSTNAYAHYI